MNDICQSCGMTMNKNEHGTNMDGSVSEDYCKYCFNGGKFGKDETMEEMIESCVPFWVNEAEGIDESAARDKMLAIFPELKRWKKAE